MEVYLQNQKVYKNGCAPVVTSCAEFKNLTNSSSISSLSLYGSLDFFRACAIVLITKLLIYILAKQRFNGKFCAKIWSKRNKSGIIKASLLSPFRIPIIDGLYHLYKFRKDGVRALEEMSEKFGYLYEVAIGPIKTTVVADACIAQKILCSLEPAHLNKPQAIYGRIFVDWFHDGLVNSEYATWSPHRKMLSRCFTYKSLQHYLKIMNTHARNLSKNLISASSPNTNNNNNDRNSVEAEKLFDIIYCHAMKIVAQMLMGVDKFSEETMAEFTRNFHAYKHLVLERFLNPQLQFGPYWKFHPKRKDYDRLNSYLTNFIMQLTQIYRREREQVKGKCEDGMPKFDKDSELFDVGEKPFRCVIEEMLCCDATDKEIYDEVGTLLATGNETGCVAIQMLLLNLALNPEHQQRCQEEVDNLFLQKDCNVNSSNDWEMSMDDLSQLKYLERCILESGRLTSTVPVFIRRLDSPLKINGDLELSAGTNVSILPWVLHKNPKYYDFPEKFFPDRFLPENVRQRHPYAYIPFSMGVRNCLGYKVAIMEIKVVMTWILRHFDIYTSDKLEDVKLLFEVTLQPERNYNIMLKSRY